jgi:tRNA pseudouridine55 synthase
VVAVVRRVLDTRRVGHTGTLDPMASGVLPVLVGRATRLSRYAAGLVKRYTGIIRLGITTDTDDRTGVVLREDPHGASVSDVVLAAAVGDLQGRLRQVPPVYSAKKVSGTPAHRRVRRGQQVTLAAQDVEVYRFSCDSRNGADLHVTAEVSSGTYIRALARDLGTRLGCGAHLFALRRTAVGPWDEHGATPLEGLDLGTVRPAADAVAHLAAHRLEPEEADAVRHGRSIAAPGDLAGPVALFEGEELLAVADIEGDALRPRVVLAG